MNKKKAASATHTQAPAPAELSAQLILITHITPDPNQPRKQVNAADLGELALSVKQHGLLQPLLLRTTAKKNHYLLVCGERRYRAAKEAGLTHIPATIRTLTDSEALEIQIIENLQRKDVLPMEEAAAFRRLEGTLDVKEIGARIGKSDKYVAQRLKLNDLIGEFAAILTAGKMKLTEALLLCRLPEAVQREILKECNLPKHWQKDKDFQLSNLSYYLRRQEQDLDKASFNTEDPLLYPEMGVCSKCPYNSNSNKLLFPELQKKRICHNPVCFSIKTKRSYSHHLEEAIQAPHVLLVTTSSYLYGEDKAKVKAAEELGAVVLTPDLFKAVQAPQKPLSWEEYKKENDDWTGEENMSAEEKKEAEQHCLDQWQQQVQYVAQKQKEYEELKASGSLRKAFVIAGYGDRGRMMEVVLHSKKGVTVELGQGNEAVQTALELSRLKEREGRNQELDREKVYKKVCETLKELPSFLTAAPLIEVEWVGVMLVLYERASYGSRQWLQQALELQEGNHYTMLDLYQALCTSKDKGLFYQFIRRTLLDALINSTELDQERYGKPAAIYAIAQHYLPEQVSQYEAEQKEKAAKRQQNVEKRLALLEVKTELKRAA